MASVKGLSRFCLSLRQGVPEVARAWGAVAMLAVRLRSSAALRLSPSAQGGRCQRNRKKCLAVLCRDHQPVEDTAYNRCTALTYPKRATSVMFVDIISILGAKDVLTFFPFLSSQNLCTWLSVIPLLFISLKWLCVSNRINSTYLLFIYLCLVY